jgi:hypothetical protein
MQASQVDKFWHSAFRLTPENGRVWRMWLRKCRVVAVLSCEQAGLLDMPSLDVEFAQAESAAAEDRLFDEAVDGEGDGDDEHKDGAKKKGKKQKPLAGGSKWQSRQSSERKAQFEDFFGADRDQASLSRAERQEATFGMPARISLDYFELRTDHQLVSSLNRDAGLACLEEATYLRKHLLELRKQAERAKKEALDRPSQQGQSGEKRQQKQQKHAGGGAGGGGGKQAVAKPILMTRYLEVFEPSR